MGRRRGGRFHGVEVKRRATNGPGDRRAAQVLIRRICVRYEDGRRVCFIPEAGEEFFSQDDANRVVGRCARGQRPRSDLTFRTILERWTKRQSFAASNIACCYHYRRHH